MNVPTSILTIIILLLIYLHFLLSTEECEGFSPSNRPGPPRHRINIFGTRSPLFQEESQEHTYFRKSAVPRGYAKKYNLEEVD